MRFSISAVLAVFNLGSQVFAAPASNSISTKREDFVTSLETSFTQLNVSVSENVAALNSSAAANNGKPTLSAAFTSLGGIGKSLTQVATSVSPLLENPVLDFTIEDIKVLVNVLEIYKDVLSEVEQTVDAVVNAFFPGFLEAFRPFIQIWINVVDSFTDPFLDYWTQLVGSLTGSPELVAEINDYIEEIKEIRDDFLLAF